MWETYELFKQYSPDIVKDIVRHTEIGSDEIWVELRDGRQYIYDMFGDILFDYNINPIDSDYYYFKKRVEYTMRRLRMSRKSLIIRTGIKETRISKYLNGEIELNEIELQKIAEILGIPFDYVY